MLLCVMSVLFALVACVVLCWCCCCCCVVVAVLLVLLLLVAEVLLVLLLLLRLVLVSLLVCVGACCWLLLCWCRMMVGAWCLPFAECCVVRGVDRALRCVLNVWYVLRRGV